MSVCYSQSALVGYHIARRDAENVISKPEYMVQPKFNTRTGKKIGTERVLVKERQADFRWLGVKADGFYELLEEIAAKYSVNYAIDQDGHNGYIGLNVMERERGYSEADLLDGSISLFNVLKMSKEMEHKFGNKTSSEPCLHLVSNIG